MEENKKLATKEETVTSENENLLVLQKPLDYEGKHYTEIDLSKLGDLKTSDLIKARKLMNQNGASLEMFPERSQEFACIMAHLGTGLPIELFQELSIPDGMTLKGMVINFLY